MSSAALQPSPHIDLHRIKLVPESGLPEIAVISHDDGFFLNTAFTTDFRLRASVYDRLKTAQRMLPPNCHFMIYEAYRPLKRQIDLWDRASCFIKEKYPAASAGELRALTETFVADPHDGIGSGHQACCAVDISLCDDQGVEYDMGTKCQEIHAHTPTQSPGISASARKNRDMLVRAMAAGGFVNYPSEWWHYSYGDHLWAYLTGRAEAVFGPIDI